MSFEIDSQTLRLQLDLMKDAEPIKGSVRDAAGTAHPFTGWLELVQTLERLRADGATTEEDRR
ncbi:hypothetical protein NLX83_34860 [Allokutzneria sp. A3M-2-11 16]|uniref:hypothetical protein n=1 Tax=Allokutzneria sp. A3M-2-11 16 TaxID=2962043 RepID=UPI0020B87167|nr:hypothetical protein [Allokutzneria sp. A3M-2-11 16]MCP3804462.1 hypothetical protein [Allokutzneria sp. A3M-2-11 16]